MSVIRVEKNKNYTVMSNYHLKEKNMSTKAIGLLSIMLSLPDNWDYSIEGLTSIRKESKNTIASMLKELEKFGYLTRKHIRNEKGVFQHTEYIIHEKPVLQNKDMDEPILKKQELEKQELEKRELDFEAQLSTKELSTKELSKECVEDLPHTQENTSHTLTLTLTQEEYDYLISKYDNEVVNRKVERAKGYKNCNNITTIESWIKEELEKNKSTANEIKTTTARPKPVQNKFNNFPQRNYSQEELDELERKLLRR